MDVRSAAAIILLPTQLPDSFEFPKLDGSWTPVHALFPNSTINGTKYANMVLTSVEIAEFLVGTKSLYLYGRTEYRDVFNRPHFTEFGRRVSASQEVRNKLATKYEAADLKLEFQVIPLHNSIA